jgi:hypothetical protein
MMSSRSHEIVTLHFVPYSLLVMACIVSLALASLFWLGWATWLVAFLVIGAWMPVIFYAMKSVYQNYKWLALLFVLVVAQTLHFFEHFAQMVQIHLLGLSGARAGGIVSTLNTEWVHFLWNSWVLLLSTFLICLIRRNVWLLSLFLFAIWHEIEHAYIMTIYLRTHREGNPGLLAFGGALGGGLPLLRPDLHFLYAVIEETLLLLAYYLAFKKAQPYARGAVRTA